MVKFISLKKMDYSDYALEIGSIAFLGNAAKSHAESVVVVRVEYAAPAK